MGDSGYDYPRLSLGQSSAYDIEELQNRKKFSDTLTSRMHSYIEPILVEFGKDDRYKKQLGEELVAGAPWAEEYMALSEDQRKAYRQTEISKRRLADIQSKAKDEFKALLMSSPDDPLVKMYMETPLDKRKAFRDDVFSTHAKNVEEYIKKQVAGRKKGAEHLVAAGGNIPDEMLLPPGHPGRKAIATRHGFWNRTPADEVQRRSKELGSDIDPVEALRNFGKKDVKGGGYVRGLLRALMWGQEFLAASQPGGLIAHSMRKNKLEELSGDLYGPEAPESLGTKTIMAGARIPQGYATASWEYAAADFEEVPVTERDIQGEQGDIQQRYQQDIASEWKDPAGNVYRTLKEDRPSTFMNLSLGDAAKATGNLYLPGAITQGLIGAAELVMLGNTGHEYRATLAPLRQRIKDEVDGLISKDYPDATPEEYEEALEKVTERVLKRDFAGVAIRNPNAAQFVLEVLVDIGMIAPPAKVGKVLTGAAKDAGHIAVKVGGKVAPKTTARVVERINEFGEGFKNIRTKLIENTMPGGEFESLRQLSNEAIPGFGDKLQAELLHAQLKTGVQAAPVQDVMLQVENLVKLPDVSRKRVSDALHDTTGELAKLLTRKEKKLYKQGQRINESTLAQRTKNPKLHQQINKAGEVTPATLVENYGHPHKQRQPLSQGTRDELTQRGFSPEQAKKVLTTFGNLPVSNRAIQELGSWTPYAEVVEEVSRRASGGRRTGAVSSDMARRTDAGYSKDVNAQFNTLRDGFAKNSILGQQIQNFNEVMQRNNRIHVEDFSSVEPSARKKLIELTRAIKGREWGMPAKDVDVLPPDLGKEWLRVTAEAGTPTEASHVFLPKTIVDLTIESQTRWAKAGLKKNDAIKAANYFMSDLYTPMHQLSKMGYTVVSPMFGPNNFLGAAKLTILDRGFKGANPKVHSGAAIAALLAHIPGNATPEMAAKFAEKFPWKTKSATWTLPEIIKEARKVGFVDEGDFRIFEGQQRSARIPGVKQAWGAVQGTAEFLTAPSRAGNRVIESYQKLVAFMGHLDGKDPASIAHAVQKTVQGAGVYRAYYKQIDQWGRGLQSFYSWNRFYKQKLAETALNAPHRIAFFEKTRDLMENMTTTPEELVMLRSQMPEYYEVEGAVVAGEEFQDPDNTMVKGMLGERVVYYPKQSPAADWAKFASLTMKNPLAADLSLVIKAGIGAMWGFDPETGQDIPEGIGAASIFFKIYGEGVTKRAETSFRGLARRVGVKRFESMKQIVMDLWAHHKGDEPWKAYDASLDMRTLLNEQGQVPGIRVPGRPDVKGPIENNLQWNYKVMRNDVHKKAEALEAADYEVDKALGE